MAGGGHGDIQILEALGGMVSDGLDSTGPVFSKFLSVSSSQFWPDLSHAVTLS